ncbi:hypothetical protein Droror1_Dr00016356 [Drosera rotundifolia]
MASPLLLSPHLHHIHRLPFVYSLPHSPSPSPSPPIHRGSRLRRFQVRAVNGSAIEKRSGEEYPSGEFEMEEVDVWRRLGVKGSHYHKSAKNLEKAAYGPHIAGIYLQVDPLNCGPRRVRA